MAVRGRGKGGAAWDDGLAVSKKADGAKERGVRKRIPPQRDHTRESSDIIATTSARHGGAESAIVEPPATSDTKKTGKAEKGRKSGVKEARGSAVVNGERAKAFARQCAAEALVDHLELAGAHAASESTK